MATVSFPILRLKVPVSSWASLTRSLTTVSFPARRVFVNVHVMSEPNVTFTLASDVPGLLDWPLSQTTLESYLPRSVPFAPISSMSYWPVLTVTVWEVPLPPVATTWPSIRRPKAPSSSVGTVTFSTVSCPVLRVFVNVQTMSEFSVTATTPSGLGTSSAPLRHSSVGV